MNNNHINPNASLRVAAANNAATQLLQSFFNHSGSSSRSTNGLVSGTHALINTPVYLVSQGGKLVTVQLSYYLGSNGLSYSNRTLKTLINALTQVYGSTLGHPVTVQLELVRQHQPYMDASILAQYLAINLSKQGFSRITNLLLNAVPYLNPVALGSNAFDFTTSAGLSITGIKVQLSGLLTSQRNRSRKTTYTATAGTFNRTSTVGTSLITLTTDYASHTSKSGLGAFTVKV